METVKMETVKMEAMNETKTRVQMTPQRRAEIAAAVKSRAQKLAIKHGITVPEPEGGEFCEEVWLWGLAFRLFARSRRALLGAAYGEAEAVLAGLPQTQAGRAFGRCHALLFRLLITGARQEGLL